MDLDLSGKTALVCGASQGIGAAIAKGLAEQGATLVLLARSKDKLEALKAELPNSNKHHIIVRDVSDRNSLKEAVEKQIEEHGPIQILVNNTGGPKPGLITEAREEEFLEAYKNHVLVSALLTDVLTFGMKQSHYGRVINIISISVKTPIPNLGVSNTTRAAMAGWSKTLSLELAPFGITVNNILPGYIETERLHSVLDANALKVGHDPSDLKEKIMKDIPMQRFGEASEVASLATFLASPAASYISGTNIPVDGAKTPTF